MAYSGFEKCGKVVYTIEPLSYIDDPSAPLVVEEDGLIKLQPTFTFSPGLFELKFVGTLERYPEVTMVELFKVEVLPCATTLSALSIVTPINVVNTWYQPDDGTNYSMTLSELTQEPGCGYNVIPQLWLTDDIGNLLPPNSGPIDVVSSPGSTTIFAEKCTEATMSLDPDCAQSPSELVIPFILVVLLDDGNVGTPNEQSVQIPVTVTLLDPCAGNTISLQDTILSMDYLLTVPAAEAPYQPTLVTDIETCPIQCRLFEMPD